MTKYALIAGAALAGIGTNCGGQDLDTQDINTYEHVLSEILEQIEE